MDQLSVPTTDQFRALAGAESRFTDTFWPSERVILIELHRAFDSSPERPVFDVPILARQFKLLLDESLNAALDSESMCALSWLESQPSFLLAVKDLGYSHSQDGWPVVFEEMISAWLSSDSYPNGLRYRLYRRCIAYTRYVSGVASACHRYLTRKAANEALEGLRLLTQLRERLSEIEGLIEHPAIPEKAREIWSGHWVRRAVEKLNDESIFEGPLSRRNDPDLPARLMAVELIQLHLRTSKAPHKRAVFNLMGLPFVETELEMRTIERLVKAERERNRKGSSRQKDDNNAESSDVTA